MNIDLNHMNKNEKKILYMQNMRPMLNKEALFCDENSEYRLPPEPDKNSEVRIRFRTAVGNVDRVYLCIGDEGHLMEHIETDMLFDYYEYMIKIEETQIKYYFKIVSGFEECFYDKSGVCDKRLGWYDFVITPGFKTPDWAKGAVMYQIYTDRFFNGDKSNDVETREYSYIGDYSVKVDDWYKYPATMGVREFYGGDIQGVWDKLDYLEKLGVEVIYFNPMFVSPSNHKYDIQDYDYIDPHFGKIVKDEGELLSEGNYLNREASRYITRVTDKANLEASNELFARFVEEVHRRGMKVILDGVFNHCGSFNKWLDREQIYENQEGYEKGAYVSGDSPYRSFFKFFEDAWPYNYHYNGWWGHDTLPKLNYEESPKLYEYIMKIARKWVSPPYNVDGWRLDVAADLGHSGEFNHKFWKDFRKNVKEANPEAIILAEHYGDPGSWLQGDEWDTVMNYDAFMEPITWFLTGMEKHSDEKRDDLRGDSYSFFASMRHHMSRFQGNSLLVAMNELSNHDHSRFMTRTNGNVGRVASVGPQAAEMYTNKGIMKEAVIMQMTWPGAPTIYYGDEAGVCGWTDPDNRRTYPWGREDMELIEFHIDAIRIHKNNIALRKGSFKALLGEYNIIAYGRFLNDNILAIAINNNDSEREIHIPVWQLGVRDNSIMESLMVSSRDTYNVGKVVYVVVNGEIIVRLPGFSAAIYRKRVQ
ncbi:glycoside hydrolase family 13 protein [Bovifimicola ammoniilytica]|jgi:alpha-glucosidase|uniref:glycoside hydrolase family 13 protein n=1 Tax=Bovifimicola ammoniilytica TaxID=2981720 RepID=UPI0003370C3B|nr:putative neopullulanase 1 [Eubacterium sp. CAG:603]SCJ09740.1 Neopullulanase 1 precursor [uncultured Eubacterium sp.]